MKLRTVRLVPIVGSLVVFAQSPPIKFGRGYDELKPPQQALVVDWAQRFNKVTKGKATNAEIFEAWPLSARTTFDAVTHALMTTKLTRKDGSAAGTALDLVAQLETVNGKIEGASGDHQYRLYVVLKPDALKTLSGTQPFSRAMDNTVYHKEYPLSYRQEGGAPSIQFSIEREGKRADIDVDYRSSKFPKALFNGHLTSSNSDVTSGNNHERHVNRWEGLTNWWKSLFGLPLTASAADSSRFDIPTAPKVKGKAKPDESAHDFLQSWLVRQKPGEALAYMSDRAYACLELNNDARAADRGMAPFLVLQHMQQVNTKMGKIAGLESALEAFPVENDRLKEVDQPYGREFALYDVPESLGFAYECYYRLHPDEAAKHKPSPDKYGRFYASIFRLKAPMKGEPVAALWAKEGDFWKIVSLVSEADARSVRIAGETAASSAPAPPPAPRQFVSGDPDFIRATGDFLTKWLVKHNYNGAMAYFAPDCDECVRLEAEKPVTNPRTTLQSSLKEIVDTIHRAGSLTEIVQAADPSHADLRFIHHNHEPNFVLLSVPNSIGQYMECKSQASAKPYAPTGPPVYGTYYAVGLTLNVPGDPPVLYLLWKKIGTGWKIIAFKVQDT